jgi:hypothetical protein
MNAPRERIPLFVIARSASDEAIHALSPLWIASPSLSSGRPLRAGPVGSHLRIKGSLRVQNNLAHDFAIGDRGKGSGGFGQRISRMHMRTELTLDAPTHDVV